MIRARPRKVHCLAGTWNEHLFITCLVLCTSYKIKRNLPSSIFIEFVVLLSKYRCLHYAQHRDDLSPLFSNKPDPAASSYIAKFNYSTSRHGSSRKYGPLVCFLETSFILCSQIAHILESTLSTCSAYLRMGKA